MTLVRFVCGTLLLLAPLLALRAYGDESPIESADRLFRDGKFAEAQALYSRIQAQNPSNFQAALRLGTIALFKNQRADAEASLRKALQLKPDNQEAKKVLARVLYRKDDFAHAAPLFRALGAEPIAKKLASFAGLVPYQIEAKTPVTEVPFIFTDPLPLIEVKLNGDKKAIFIIDTGGSEIYLDPEIAKELKALQFGSTTGIYGGGLQADTAHGRIDSIGLGDFVVRNVPVHILSTRRFAAVAHGKSVEGILGTTMLSHFLATLDYPHGKLILRQKAKHELQKFEQEAKEQKAEVIPFWMAGDHFMVAWGQVNQSKPMLFFVDTGLAGGGFLCPLSTLKDAAIALPQGAAFEGVGGGGKMKIVPYVVDEVSLGNVKERKIRAFHGAFPPALEYSEGFRIGGLISHQFFRPYALTFDFTGMRLVLKKKSDSGRDGTSGR
jgi:tetratricopeptide (TPR) repeat protein